MTKTADEWAKIFDTMNLRQAADELMRDLALDNGLIGMNRLDDRDAKSIAAAMDGWHRTCVTVDFHKTSRQVDALKEILARPAIQEVDALIAALRACLWCAWRAPGGHGRIIDIASATLARAGAAPIDVDAPSPPPLVGEEGNEEEDDEEENEFVPTLPCQHRQEGNRSWCTTCDLKWDSDGVEPHCPYEVMR